MKKSRKVSKKKSVIIAEELVEGLLIYSDEHGERFGQRIWNALAHSGYWESPDGNPLFFISDKKLIDILNRYANQE